MRNKAELLDWYRNLWLFSSERQQKNYMLDVNLEEPTPVDMALSQSGFALGTAELAAKKVLHAPAPSPPENPDPPIRRELSLTAGSKRARSWPAAAAPRKSGAPSPRPETQPFGLLNHGVQSKPEVSELIASMNQTDDEAEFRKRQQDLISKLIGGELSSDEEPAAEEKNETEQPTPEEKAEDREEGEIPATQTYPEAENEMLAEERSSSPEGLEPEEPAKDANGYYTFKGFTLSVKEKPASEPSPQLKLKTSRLKRETSRPKKLYDEMLDDLELAEGGMSLVEKGSAAARRAKQERAEAAPPNVVPASSSAAVQRIEMASEINQRLMTGVTFRLNRTQDTKMYKMFEAMARVAISFAAVTQLKEEFEFNTDPVDEFHRKLFGLLAGYMLGDGVSLAETAAALQQRIDYREDEDSVSKLGKCSWIARFTFWAYKDMRYQEDTRPGKDYVRLTFSGCMIAQLREVKPPVIHCRKADMNNIWTMRCAFWPLDMLIARARDMVVNLLQASKEKMHSWEVIKVLSEKQQDMQSSFIRWSNAVRLTGCESYVFGSE
jgi:hypothetical protein